MEKAFPRLLEDFLSHTRSVHGFNDESIARLRRVGVGSCIAMSKLVNIELLTGVMLCVWSQMFNYNCVGGK